MKSKSPSKIAINHSFKLGLISFALMTTSLVGSPFDRLITFGDSLVDTGNHYELTGGMLPPAPAYWNGRFSNNIVWTEYVANDLSVDMVDYAFGGAKTDGSNYNEGVFPFSLFPLTGLQQQVDLFLQDTLEERVTNRDLFAVVIGANDFFDFLERDGDFPIPASADNALIQVERLLQAGARHLIVLNVPDLASTPAFATRSNEEKTSLRYLVSTYNQMVADGLNQLSDSYKCHIVVVDTYRVINDVIANPVAYNLTNVFLPALFFPTEDPETSLFWDGVHPTTVGHRIIADSAIDAMLKEYIPGVAIGLGMNLPGWIEQ